MAAITVNLDSDRADPFQQSQGTGPVVTVEPHPSVPDCYRLAISDAHTKDSVNAWFTRAGLARLARAAFDAALAPDPPLAVVQASPDKEALPF